MDSLKDGLLPGRDSFWRYYESSKRSDFLRNPLNF